MIQIYQHIFIEIILNEGLLRKITKIKMFTC